MARSAGMAASVAAHIFLPETWIKLFSCSPLSFSAEKWPLKANDVISAGCEESAFFIVAEMADPMALFKSLLRDDQLAAAKI